MTEYPYYYWDQDPPDGEYELQFDRFETPEGGDPLDLVVLLINRGEKPVGEVYYPTDDVPGIDPDEAVGTAIFHGTIEDQEIVSLVYDPELSAQRQQEMKELHDHVRATSNDENQAGH